MDLLTIKHTDFEMAIECTKFDAIWAKAANNVGADNLLSTYSWSDECVVQLTVDERQTAINNGEKARAIFFDNADYPIWVDFEKHVKHAEFGSMLQSENDRFKFRRGVLAGFLNYGNEIGRSEIQLVYKVEGDEVKRFTFSFEVLSTKLNYHDHWGSIIEDIEREYRMLSLDYMRRTFHGFSPDVSGKTPELIWWSVFQGEQEKFIKAIKNIIDRPKRRLRGTPSYKRADKLTFIPRGIENELAEHRTNEAHLYQVDERTQTNDTQENRFLKFALSQISSKYENLKNRIEATNNASETMRTDMERTQQKLHGLVRNPFFRTIGRFKGIAQESLVLQKATGYSQVYRTWNLLRRAYSLNDGIYRLQTKDIATLYEIWCFIEVSHIVKEQLKLDDKHLDHRNRMEMNGLFTWDMGKGEHSRILFKKDDVELAELVYNPKHTDRENDNVGISDLVVPTVPQKPDIVLQLTKNDLHKGMKFTYLFDAKYRIEGRDSKGVDTPPDDAINQMHRYRDAIYYNDYEANALKKEVIGGYILFPGDGQKADVEVSKFYKTIDEVNIGAFPLRPKDENNRALLEDFIGRLIDSGSANIVGKVIPQKGTFVEVGNRVLIGLVKSSNRTNYLQDFIDSKAKLYYTGAKFPTTIALQDLHFFMPYMKGEGIRDVYEITKVRTISSGEAKQSDDEGDDLRLAFELRFSHRLFANYQPIDTNRMINYTFIDTTFDNIKKISINNTTDSE